MRPYLCEDALIGPGKQGVPLLDLGIEASISSSPVGVFSKKTNSPGYKYFHALSFEVITTKAIIKDTFVLIENKIGPICLNSIKIPTYACLFLGLSNTMELRYYISIYFSEGL